MSTSAGDGRVGSGGAGALQGVAIAAIRDDGAASMGRQPSRLHFIEVGGDDVMRLFAKPARRCGGEDPQADDDESVSSVAVNSASCHDPSRAV